MAVFQAGGVALVRQTPAGPDRQYRADGRGSTCNAATAKRQPLSRRRLRRLSPAGWGAYRETRPAKLRRLPSNRAGEGGISLTATSADRLAATNQPPSQHDTGITRRGTIAQSGQWDQRDAFNRTGHRGSPRAHVVTVGASKIARPSHHVGHLPASDDGDDRQPVAGRQPWRQLFSPALRAFLAKQNSRRLRPFAPLRPLRGASRRRAGAFRPIEAGRRPE